MPQQNLLIRPETTLLAVVDLQEKLAPAIEGVDAVVANTKTLLRLAKILSLPTVVTTQYRKGLGATLPEIAELAAVEALDKVCFGCTGNEAFRRTLSETLPKGGAVLLAGVEAHICVTQTALGLIEEGYCVHVVSDAIGSRTAASAQLGIGRMRGAGAVISSTEMASYELLGDSRRPEFKQMLPYFK